MPTAQPQANSEMQGEGEPTSRSLFRLSAPVAIALVMLAVVFFGLIRYRLRDMPLERDEGEYAYSGQLLLQGIPPYKLAYSMKLPGIYVAYAAILAVFGQTPAGIHLGLLLVNALTILLLYCLTRRLAGRLAGSIAAASYAALSTSSSVMGFEAHATNFVVLPAIAGILILLRALESSNLFLLLSSGLFLGIAMLMKQHGLFFVLFSLFYLAWSEWEQKISPGKITCHAAVLICGVILPYATACLWLYRAGVFRQFWFWTVSYAGEYSKIGTHRAIRAFLENSRTVMGPALPIWILAAFGISAFFWSEKARAHSHFMAGLFLFSLLSLCPGAYFRPHYFILLLPVTAMLAGIGVSSATGKLTESSKSRYLVFLPGLVFLAALGCAIFQQRQVYFRMDTREAFQSAYGISPFLPAKEVADYVRENSPETARIAVIGSEPEIYFYAHRHSATGYIYMYSLIGRQKFTTPMRAEMMDELETNHPDYLIYVDTWDSWGEREGAPQAADFLAWLKTYMGERFEQVGVADIGDPTQYVWGEAAKTYHPESSKVIYVLKRRDSLPVTSVERPRSIPRVVGRANPAAMLSLN